ncbi:MAG: carboxypeptidase regulatory-like domain-containing protein [Candidatus Eremiobacteraeota bacterium]|nr:carboxypeptidase regulatory-like domain-containing protein [Candidatus Eremiobacteraeota bacterium]
MKATTHRLTLTLLLVSILLLSALNGCADSGTSATSYWGGGSQGAATYKVSGTIVSPITLQPIQGMACSLQALDGSKSALTTTDAQGSYSFSDLAAGNYRLVTTRDGNITDNSYFTVTQDMTINQTSIKKDDWTVVMGADHPYDATKAYVSAVVDHTGGGTPPVKTAGSPRDAGKDGVVVDLFSKAKARGSGYQARCYFDASGKADWNATSTSSSGVALFYQASSSDSYTMVATKSGHTFDNVNNIAPVQGEFTNYLMNSKSAGSAVKLTGLCFGPYLTGAPPDQRTVDQLTTLITPIANYTNGIRTYSMTSGLDQIPGIAKGLGLKVVACAWLDGTNTANGTIAANQIPEIQNLVTQATAHNVDIALVGSETTNNGLSIDNLKQYITDTKALLSGTTTSSGAPVQVASGLMFSEASNTAVGNLCDVLFVHVYPCYASPSGTAPTSAAISANLDWAYNYFKGLYPDVASGSKQFIIGEIGWATAGSDPSCPLSVFNTQNAATHLQTVMTWASTNNVEYYYFEAYDEPWKAANGNWEGSFGLWDSSMNIKPDISKVLGITQ